MSPPPTGTATPGVDGFSDPLPSGVTIGHLHWFRRLLGFMGPGYLVAIGYIDPGNWARSEASCRERVCSTV